MNTTIFDIITRENQEQAAALKQTRELLEKDYCIRCGVEITDYEETEFNGNHLTMTYRCPCGCYAE